jgi:hypothetical protein
MAALSIYSRRELCPTVPDIARPTLLLEGSWPDGGGHRRWSLDDDLDGTAVALDAEVDRLAAIVAAEPDSKAPTADAGGVSLAWLNALRLRYDLLKALRLVSFLARGPLSAADRMELYAERNRDELYADVVAAVASTWRAAWKVFWREPKLAPRVPAGGLAWRDRFGQWLNVLAGTGPEVGGPRIWLCGDRRILGGVCGEFLCQGAHVDWLYERFAWRTWLAWGWRGMGQVLCPAHAADHITWRCRSAEREGLSVHSVDLGPLVDAWLARCAVGVGARQAQFLEQLADACDRCRPAALVLDEDATPMARASVAVARSRGVPSAVVQHGVPYGRWGFSPLAADRLLAWSDGSRERFIGWGIARERIVVTGAPQHDDLRRRSLPLRRVPARRPRILLLATTPPRDDRPEPAAFYLTSRTYAELIRMAVEAVARVNGAELIVKLHPRRGNRDLFQTIAADACFERLRIVRHVALAGVLRHIDCALSCGSGAGIEAALAGVPTIELRPPRSVGLPRPEDGGLLGPASTPAELDRLLSVALSSRGTGASEWPRRVSARSSLSAAACVARHVLRWAHGHHDAPDAPVGANPVAAADPVTVH